MSFQSALSGLNAAAGNLNVTGHNIANASTTGFKRSRAEFADVYAVSFGGVSKTATGSGVRLSNVAQQFSQGNIDFTDNNLDLAINKEGFFVLDDNGTKIYSRAGAFSVDRDGYIVNAHGQKLQQYAVDSTGSVSNFTPTDIQLNLGANPANATTELGLNVQLDAASELDNVLPLDPTNPDTYNFSTTTTIYDSLGVTHDASLFFQKAPQTTSIALNGIVGNTLAGDTTTITTTVYDAAGASYPATITFTALAAGGSTFDVDYTIGATAYPTIAGVDISATSSLTLDAAFDPNVLLRPSALTLDISGLNEGTTSPSVPSAETTNNGPYGEWNTMLVIDGQQFDTEIINFNTDGSLATTPTDVLYNDNTASFTPPGADPISLTVNYAGSTQFGADSTINNLTQDGYTTGTLSGLSVSSTGVVFARYSNGQSENLGAVALARFSNVNGLSQLGDTSWGETFESGSPQAGQAGTGTFGTIQSGALEASNVDISKQLVNMIIAQRDFQANAKMISTEDAVTQTIINIR